MSGTRRSSSRRSRTCSSTIAPSSTWGWSPDERVVPVRHGQVRAEQARRAQPARFFICLRDARRALRRHLGRRAVGRDLQRDLQRGPLPLDRRPLMLIDRDPPGALPVRRHPLVQHRVRPRRHHHRAAAALARPGDRRGRAQVPRREPGDRRTEPEADAEPGKILHETRQGEMARARRGPLRPLLRQRRRTPLFVMLAGHVLRAHRRPRHDPGALAEPRGGAALDRRATAIATATASSSTRVGPKAASATRAGRIRRTRSSTPTAGSPTGAIALCEVQGYVYAAKRHAAQLAAALGLASLADSVLRRRPRPCRSASRRRSGARSSAPTRWPSTATSSPAGSAPRTPARSCSRASRSRERAAQVAHGLMDQDFFSGLGHPHGGRRRKPATIPCRITTARSGRTTTR